MCCGNWKALAVLAVLGVGIFVVAPGWDTAAFGLGFAVLAALSKWLGDRGALGSECAIGQRQARATQAEGSGDRRKELRSQLRRLHEQEAALGGEIAKYGRAKVPEETHGMDRVASKR